MTDAFGCRRIKMTIVIRTIFRMKIAITIWRKSTPLLVIWCGAMWRHVMPSRFVIMEWGLGKPDEPFIWILEMQLNEMVERIVMIKTVIFLKCTRILPETILMTCLCAYFPLRIMPWEAFGLITI